MGALDGQRAADALLGFLVTFVRNSLVGGRAAGRRFPRAGGVLVSLVDGFQRQMFVDLKAPLAFVTGYQLDLRAGQAFGRQARSTMIARPGRLAGVCCAHEHYSRFPRLRARTLVRRSKRPTRAPGEL